MILFFYGEDTYRLSKKLQELKERFVSASLGDTNLVTIEGEKASYQDLNRQIMALPFLSKKRQCLSLLKTACLIAAHPFLKN